MLQLSVIVLAVAVPVQLIGVPSGVVLLYAKEPSLPSAIEVPLSSVTVQAVCVSETWAPTCELLQCD